MTGQELRDQIAEALREVFDYQIIAEWICCEPVNPAHDLCAWGETVRQAVQGLLSDHAGDQYGRSKVLDQVTGKLQARLGEQAAEIERLTIAWQAQQPQAELAASVHEAALQRERQRAEQAEADRDELKIDNALMSNDQMELAKARKEVERLRQHILDIDAHATPYGDLPEEPGYVGTYLVTAGALHRALGKIGHTAPKCEAEADRDRLRTWDGLMGTLAELYPPDVIDGSSGDPGPQIITLAREVDKLREARDRAREREERWEVENAKVTVERDRLREVEKRARAIADRADTCLGSSCRDLGAILAALSPAPAGEEVGT